MAIQSATSANFKDSIRKEGLTFVDFTAPWCAPCKVLLPILEELSEENKKVKVLKVNCDDQPDLASTYQVMSMPTVIVFHNGEPVEKLIGLRPKSAYQSLITKYK